MALKSVTKGCPVKTPYASTLPVSCRPCVRPAGVPNWRSKHTCQPPSAVSFDSLSFDADLDLESAEVQELYKDFDTMLETARVQFDIGDVVTAEVYSADGKGAYVDYGGKQVGWVASAEASMCPKLKVNCV